MIGLAESKTRTRVFRRKNFRLLKELLDEIPWESEEWTGTGSSLMFQQGEMVPDESGGLLDGVTALVDKGQATDVVCLDLCKAFDMAPQHNFVS